MIDPLDIERVAKWTGEPVTPEQFSRLLEVERTKIEPLPTATKQPAKGKQTAGFSPVGDPPLSPPTPRA